jgi:hypothetical protein
MIVSLWYEWCELAVSMAMSGMDADRPGPGSRRTVEESVCVRLTNSSMMLIQPCH